MVILRQMCFFFVCASLRRIENSGLGEEFDWVSGGRGVSPGSWAVLFRAGGRPVRPKHGTMVGRAGPAQESGTLGSTTQPALMGRAQVGTARKASAARSDPWQVALR